MRIVKDNTEELPINKRITRREICKGRTPNSVDVIMVVSRQHSEGFYTKAMGSILYQEYTKVGLIEINNLDKKLSIGEAWNLGVKASKARFVFFLGDDDFISNDLIHSCVAYFKHMALQADQHQRIDAAKTKKPKPVEDFKPVCVTCGSYAVDINDNILEHRNEYVTGMWTREYLDKNPFNETLPSQVDTDMFERTEKHRVAYMYHNTGYFYRQHPGQVSGMKTIVVKDEN